MDMDTINIIAMGITLVVLIIAVHYAGQHSVSPAESKQTVFEKNRRMEWIFFGIVLLVAFTIRIWDFGILPYGMNQDGAMGAVDAKALADHGTDRLGMYMPVHFTAWGYGQMSVLLSYLSIPFIKLFGLNPVTARLPVLIISMLAIAVLYLLIKEISGITPAQIALVLVSFTPWHFMQSRWALDCNMFPHMMLFGVFFLYRGIKYRKRNLYLSMVFFALCMYSYGVSFYTVPVFLLCSCIYLLVKRLIRVRDLLICIGIYFLISWPIYLTMLINTMRWPTIETPFFTIPFFPESMRSGDILFFSEHPWEQLVENAKALWNVFCRGDDMPWNTIHGFGTIFPFLVPFAMVGIAVVVTRFFKIGKRRVTETVSEEAEDPIPVDAVVEERPESEVKVERCGLVLLIFWLLTALFCGLITATVNVNRENILMYCMVIFAAYGVWTVFKQRKILLYILVPVFLFYGTVFQTTYHSQAYTDSMSLIFMGGFGECLDELEERDCREYYIDADCHFERALKVLELNVLFYLEVDSEFYRSEGFGEKYHFVADQPIPPDIPEGVGYVVPKSVADTLNSTQYSIIYHGNYAAVFWRESPDESKVD